MLAKQVPIMVAFSAHTPGLTYSSETGPLNETRLWLHTASFTNWVMSWITPVVGSTLRVLRESLGVMLTITVTIRWDVDLSSAVLETPLKIGLIVWLPICA